MAVKKKITKVANEKRSNQKHVKTDKKVKKKIKKQKQLPKNITSNENDHTESEESDDDMLNMIDDDDLDFLKNAVARNSYSLLKNIRTDSERPSKRRKLNIEDETLEENYETSKTEEVKMKNMLPIKTKTGVIPQAIIDDTVEESEIEIIAEEQEEESSTESEKLEEDESVMTTADMLARREEAIKEAKINIGTLSSALIENPEEKLTNFKILLKIITEEKNEAAITVKKLAIVSLLEIFKDLLPLYQIRQHDFSVKLKKDTLNLQKFETSLLQYYKNYLKTLEKLCRKLRNKAANGQKPIELYELPKLALNCMCELLVSHSNFNYAENIAKTVIPFLNNRFSPIRKMVNSCCKNVFTQDKKGEITLKMARILNQYLKTHAHNVNVEMLDILLALRIKDVNLDQEKEEDIKQKKLNIKKHKILQMSRKERKRKKKLEVVEREMLETKGEEDKEIKQKNLTEITKIVFGIYFRILKSSSNTKILGVCLEGLAKFAHCLNLEFYSDLVNVLSALLNENWLSYREQLHCIQTVLTMISGQGDVLNIDPSRFYTVLYKTLFTTHAGRNHSDYRIVLETLTQALLKRRRKLSQQRLVSFTKRLSTLSLQLLHNGALANLAMIKNIMQQNHAVDILLDLDTSVGDGMFLPELDEPEHSNASSTSLYELVPLSRYYHPVVSKMAKHIANGIPVTGEGTLPPEFGKCTSEELFEDYDPSMVVFKPAIPVPKKVQTKSKSKHIQFADPNFKDYCSGLSRKRLQKHDCGLYFVI